MCTPGEVMPVTGGAAGREPVAMSMAVVADAAAPGKRDCSCAGVDGDRTAALYVDLQRGEVGGIMAEMGAAFFDIACNQVGIAIRE